MGASLVESLSLAFEALFALLFAVYTVGSLLSFSPKISAWMARRSIFGRPLISVYPGWGFFAQEFGVFDLQIRWRLLTRGDDTSDGVGLIDDWEMLNASALSCGRVLWRPELRANHIGTVLGLQLIRFAKAASVDLLATTKQYRRVLSRVRREVQYMHLSEDKLSSVDVQFAIVISRGWWSADEARFVFTSRPEPLEIT